MVTSSWLGRLQKWFWYARARAYSVVFEKMGAMSYLGPPLYITGHSGISICDRVRIYPHARIECLAGGTILIGDDCSIGQSVHLISGQGNLVLGSGCTLSAGVFVSNVAHTFGESKSVMAQPTRYKETKIGRNVFIGYYSVIEPGVKIGEGAVVAAHSVVREDVPAHSMVAGIPAVFKKRVKPPEIGGQNE